MERWHSMTARQVMEMTAFTPTMTRMMTPSSQSSPPLAARDSPAAARSTRIMGSRSCPSSRASSPGPRGVSSSLGPSRSSRRAASRPLSPSGPVSSSFKMCPAGRLYQSSMVPRSLPFVPIIPGACPGNGGILERDEKSLSGVAKLPGSA